MDSTDRAARDRLDHELSTFEARRTELLGQLAARQTVLPLRFWRQHAHLTAPADREVATKALRSGTAGMARMAERYGFEPDELAVRLGADVAQVRALLERPRPAPLVVIDAEDAVALTDSAALSARAAAIDVLADEGGRSTGAAPLRFFRPPGLAQGGTARELFAVLAGLAGRSHGEALPLDGIVFPKVEHPEEVELVHDMLTSAEQALGLELGSLRTAFLVESAWAVSQLERIAVRAADRLCSLIFGLADYSADLGLRIISSHHAVADWARARMINVAAAVGVPAIDGMTLDYPVADPRLDQPANRERILQRMALVHADAVRARALGMQGKWVGHPAQLFAALLAFEADPAAADLEAEVAKLEAYDRSVHDEGRGAIIIDGVMSDRATDRHARVVLRQATAAGRFDAARAHALGVIDGAELAELTAARSAEE